MAAGVQLRFANGAPLSSLSAENGAVRKLAMKPGRSVAGTADSGDVPSGVPASAAAATGSLRSSSASGDRYVSPLLAEPCVAVPSAPRRYVASVTFAGGQLSAVLRRQAPGGYAYAAAVT